jgi:hypothetical protein
LPTAAELGLNDSFVDCEDCPTGFTVTSDGQAIAWVVNGDLVIRAIEPQIGEPEPIASVPAGYVKDLDLSTSAAVVTIFGDPPRPPLFVPLDGTESVDLEGTTATFGPAG